VELNHRLIALIPKLIRARIAVAVSRGSSMVSVASLASFINGGAYTKGASGTGRMVLRIAELNSGPGRSTVHSDIEVPEEKTANAGDILMSWSGSLDVYRWFRDEAIINQHIFKVIPTGYPSWLVFDRLEAVMPVFQGIAHDKATTMGHIQRGHLESTKVDIPSSEEIERLDLALGPLWERLLLLERENVKLEFLRDVLLPELLTGRIRVSEAEEVLA
jgi:type I restriction enzyme S subunit